jgi:hypothetical protein
LDLSGNLGLFWGSCLFNHFFQGCHSKKEVFEFLKQFVHFNHQFKLITYFTMYATTFWILPPNLGIWIQRSGAAGHMSSMAYYSNLFKGKD